MERVKKEREKEEGGKRDFCADRQKKTYAGRKKQEEIWDRFIQLNVVIQTEIFNNDLKECTLKVELFKKCSVHYSTVEQNAKITSTNRMLCILKRSLRF